MRIACDSYDERHMLLLVVVFELGMGKVWCLAQKGEDINRHDVETVN